MVLLAGQRRRGHRGDCGSRCSAGPQNHASQCACPFIAPATLSLHLACGRLALANGTLETVISTDAYKVLGIRACPFTMLFLGMQPPCCTEAQAAMWRGSHGKAPRPLAGRLHGDRSQSPAPTWSTSLGLPTIPTNINTT